MAAIARQIAPVLALEKAATQALAGMYLSLLLALCIAHALTSDAPAGTTTYTPNNLNQYAEILEGAAPSAPTSKGSVRAYVQNKLTRRTNSRRKEGC